MNLLNLFKKKEKSAFDWFKEAQLIYKEFKTANLDRMKESIIRFKNNEISWDEVERNKEHMQNILNNQIGPKVVKCFDNALYIDPQFCEALLAKGEFISKKYFMPFEYKDFVPLENRSDGAHYEFNGESIKYIKLALELNPNYTSSHYFMGMYYESENNFELAMEEFDKAIALDPKYAGALFGKIRCLAAKKMIDEANVYYRQAELLIPAILDEGILLTDRWLGYILN